MRRRELIALFSSAVVAWPISARAQQHDRLPTIGFVSGSTPSLMRERTSAFAKRLAELGWIEGKTVRLEYRWAEGQFERAPDLFRDLVQRNVNIIVTHATQNAIAAKRVTSAIPVVFATAADPVGSGIVESLARPGGNVTGLSLQATDSAGKRVELLRELLTSLRRLAVLVNLTNPAGVSEVQEAENAAHKFGIDVVKVEVRGADDLTVAFERLKGNAQALYVSADALLAANRYRVAAAARSLGLPAIQDTREFAEAGGLMAYGADIVDLFRRAAEYVDKILRGVKPSELPVEQPTKFEFVINLKTAKALGLTVPPTLLARADNVID